MDPKLKQLFEAAVVDNKVPALGAVLVNEKGEFLIRETFGTKKADDANSAPFDADTLTRTASCSKVVTSIAALQLIELGKMSLSDTVEQYVPEIAKIQVLESIRTGEKLEAVLRSAKVKPTINHLLTHTSGFTYDFFDDTTFSWRMTTGRAPSGYYGIGDWADFETPYLAEPGTKYYYGTSTDWLALVIQAVSGMPFYDYVKKFVLKPVGMNKSTFEAEIGPDCLEIHIKMNGNLVAIPSPRPMNPDVPAGGGFLCSTLNEYARLLSMLLNQGTSPVTGIQILKPDTVKNLMFTDGLPAGVDKSELAYLGPGTAQLTLPATFIPTVTKDKLGWSNGGLLLNGEDLPYGRKAGSGAWAGMMNLYYWVDPTSNLAGMVMTNMFPFMDPTTLDLFDQLERSAYGHSLAAEGEVEGRNFVSRRV